MSRRLFWSNVLLVCAGCGPGPAEKPAPVPPPTVTVVGRPEAYRLKLSNCENRVETKQLEWSAETIVKRTGPDGMLYIAKDGVVSIPGSSAPGKFWRPLPAGFNGYHDQDIVVYREQVALSNVAIVKPQCTNRGVEAFDFQLDNSGGIHLVTSRQSWYWKGWRLEYDYGDLKTGDWVKTLTLFRADAVDRGDSKAYPVSVAVRLFVTGEGVVVLFNAERRREGESPEGLNLVAIDPSGNVKSTQIASHVYAFQAIDAKNGILILWNRDKQWNIDVTSPSYQRHLPNDECSLLFYRDGKWSNQVTLQDTCDLSGAHVDHEGGKIRVRNEGKLTPSGDKTTRVNLFGVEVE